jgi:hypothetical protein
MEGGARQQLLAGIVVLVAVALMATTAEGYISKKTWAAIGRANRRGPFVGLVVPNAYEMVPVLNSPSFVASKTVPNLDVQGTRYRSTYVQANHDDFLFCATPHQINTRCGRIQRGAVVHYSISQRILTDFFW